MKKLRFLSLVLSAIMVLGLAMIGYAVEPTDLRLNSAPDNYKPSKTASNVSVTEKDMYTIIVDGAEHDIRLNSAPNGYNPSLTRGANTEENVPDFPETINDISATREANLMPTGGGEYAYNSIYWNDSANVFRANCYGYVLNMVATDTSDSYAGYLFQPGYKAGESFSLTKDSIISAVEADMQVFERSIRSSSYSEKPGADEYKIALVISSNDYHWYRQDSSGYWSHKAGLTSITNKDASGEKIIDPKTCSRKYSYADYSTWGGYYIISK